MYLGSTGNILKFVVYIFIEFHFMRQEISFGTKWGCRYIWELQKRWPTWEWILWSSRRSLESPYPLREWIFGNLNIHRLKKKSIRKRSLFLFYEHYLNSDGFLKVPPHIVIHINCNNLYNMYCLQVMYSIQKWIVWLYALNVKK